MKKLFNNAVNLKSGFANLNHLNQLTQLNKLSVLIRNDFYANKNCFFAEKTKQPVPKAKVAVKTPPVKAPVKTPVKAPVKTPVKAPVKASPSKAQKTENVAKDEIKTKAAKSSKKKSKKVSESEEVEVEEPDEIEGEVKYEDVFPPEKESSSKLKRAFASASLNNFKIDLSKNPQELGKLPLSSKAPIDFTSFPFNNKKSSDPYDNYISSSRMLPDSRSVIKQEKHYLCKNYAPLPVVINQAKGCILQDIEGFNYIDCLSGYGSINFGHSDEKIVSEVSNQISTLHLTSRAIYNTKQYETAKLAINIFGKEKIIFMNSGVEACETAVKLARRWGYRVKKIPNDQAKIVYMTGNFWGRSITACGTSEDPLRNKDFGPYDNGSYLVEYNNFEALKKIIESDPNICAVMLEPIQGEAGFIIPEKQYIQDLYKLCKEKNVLYIDDEVQAGCGRTGTKLAIDLFLGPDQKPDIIVLAKSLSNGVYPVSAVLCNSNIMDLIGPGEHGSTYSGNPVGMTAAYHALQKLCSNNFQVLKNAFEVGSYLSILIFSLKSKFIKEIRGRGMMIGIEFNHDTPLDASDFCLLLMERGMITKPTHKYNIRIAPPINITITEAEAIYEIIKFVIRSMEDHYKDYKPENPSTKLNVLYDKSTVESVSKYLNSKKVIDYTQPSASHDWFTNALSNSDVNEAISSLESLSLLIDEQQNKGQLSDPNLINLSLPENNTFNELPKTSVNTPKNLGVDDILSQIDVEKKL